MLRAFRKLDVRFLLNHRIYLSVARGGEEGGSTSSARFSACHACYVHRSAASFQAEAEEGGLSDSSCRLPPSTLLLSSSSFPPPFVRPYLTEPRWKRRGIAPRSWLGSLPFPVLVVGRGRRRKWFGRGRGKNLDWKGEGGGRLGALTPSYCTSRERWKGRGLDSGLKDAGAMERRGES